jgi:short-subunit dehydrogenase
MTRASAGASPKSVVITGASSGIGAATALALARRGMNLVLGARRVERLNAVAEKCRSACPGSKVVVQACDVACRAQVEGLIAAAAEKLGRVDVVIANAGYGLLAKIHETTEEQFDELVATNVKGTWYAMQAAAAVMLKQEPRGEGRNRRGHIIAISSGAGRRGLPLYGVYSMTKAAQLSLAEAMRVELREKGIYVSTVHPLTTATEFFDVASEKSRIRSSGVGKVQTAEAVAEKIAKLIRKPRPELWPARFSRLALSLAVFFPRLADNGVAKTMPRRTQ